MRRLFVLPATDPQDDRYGSPEGFSVPDAEVIQVRFDREVWYNASMREQTFEKMNARAEDENWLIGFSKSGHGALNLLLDAPGLFAGVIVFDVPLGLSPKPWWVSDSFYDMESWEVDLAMHRISELACVSRGVNLFHLSGANFHDQHVTWDQAMREAGAEIEFIPGPEVEHHWESGWWQRVLQMMS